MRCRRRSATASPPGSPWAIPGGTPSWRCSTSDRRPTRCRPSPRRRRSHRARPGGRGGHPLRLRRRSALRRRPRGGDPPLPAPAPGRVPRAGLQLMRAARASAALSGRDHVLPDDVQLLAAPVLAHRLLLTADAALGRRGAEQVVTELLSTVPVPADAEPPCRRRLAGCSPR
ncbi:hypothetical protein [Blastococcus sp. BMG 8361]|uniref:ChlI/MoxR AAA lid domain-containing protein n=1 Tax=Blastococcus brunescens TaxID=1564165 RepID=A0ABZ1B801_9ACTN|nr:hypothetical protein [Blastococcus sp. BMG 8361]WRL66939.1 hypothetical protein U6N30_11410 [Blastococcus sp. BMG 8361]